MTAMLKELQNWVKRIAGLRPSPTGADTHRSAGQSRDDRASSVAALQKEVRALQQEITDLIETRDSGATPGGDPAHHERLTSLRSRLTQKQADLAKFQARI